MTLSGAVFTDIVEHAGLKSGPGDLRGHVVRGDFDGIGLKTVGDGLMASFASVSRTTECAIGLQRALRDRAAKIAELIADRTGLDADEPIAERGIRSPRSFGDPIRVEAVRRRRGGQTRRSATPTPRSRASPCPSSTASARISRHDRPVTARRLVAGRAGR